jgi:hypothetical protein
MKSHTGLRSASHTLDSHWLEIGELFPRAARFESVCCIQPWSHVVAGPLLHLTQFCSLLGLGFVIASYIGFVSPIFFLFSLKKVFWYFINKLVKYSINL